MSVIARCTVALAAATVLPARAAEEVAVPSVSGVSTFAVLFQGLLGLAVVLAVMVGFFWFLRRFSPGQSGAQGAVKVVGGVMLGPRERLVVVEVGETWLMLGVGGGQVTHLHTLPKPAGYVAPAPADVSGFSDKLKDLLPKRPG